MENLRKYSLKEIPNQKGFNQKNALVNNDRYKRIASVLKDPKAKIYMSFVVFISQPFNRFLQALTDVFVNDSSTLPNMSATGWIKLSKNVYQRKKESLFLLKR